MTLLEEVMLYRDAGAVKRYHTVRMLRQQDLASHSFGVLMLIKTIDPNCSKNLLLAALHHDLPELITGDIPAPAKRASADLSVRLEELEKGTAPLHQDFGLMPVEEALLKWCDTFELVLHCTEEYLMGNNYAKAPLTKGLSWCNGDRARNVLDEFAAVHVKQNVRQLCDAMNKVFKEKEHGCQ